MTRFKAALFIWLSVVALALPSQAQELLKLTPQQFKSVVLLVGENQRACATGFFRSHNQIYTNSHVIDKVCPYGSCRGLRVLNAKTPNQPAAEELPIKSVRVVFKGGVLDAALLEVEWEKPPDISFGFLKEGELRPSSATLYSLGFPHCQKLSLASGRIESDEAIYFSSNIQGAHGSSGSPVFDAGLNLHGIIVQSNTLSGALASLFLRRTFSSRVLKSGYFIDLADLSAEARLLRESSLAWLYYVDHVRSKRGFRRMLSGFQFIALVEGLKASVLSQDAPPAQAVRSLAAMNMRLSYLAPYFRASAPGYNALQGALDKVVAAYNLELFGPFQDALTRIDYESLKRELSAPALQANGTNEILSLVQEALLGRRLGFELLSLFIASLLILFIFPWSFSLGYVFSRAKGNFLYRLVVTFAVGLFLWPISFLVFVYLRPDQK